MANSVNLHSAGRTLHAYFVDGGRVFPSLRDVTLDHPRVGFGIGLELHDNGGFLVESSVATTIDGGVALAISFTPVLDEHPRWR